MNLPLLETTSFKESGSSNKTNPLGAIRGLQEPLFKTQSRKISSVIRNHLRFGSKDPIEFSDHWIQPTYSANGIDSSCFDAFVPFIQKILKTLLSKDEVDFLSQKQLTEDSEKYWLLFSEKLPLLKWNWPDSAPCTLTATLLCHSDYTSGVGRFLCDILARWLVPGKILNISSVRSLNFHFQALPNHPLFFHQVILDIESQQHLNLLRNNIGDIDREIRLSIHAVRHARQIVSLKDLTSDQKKIIIEESLSSYLQSATKAADHNVFDQMHQLWLHLIAEDKIKQIQDRFAPYIESRPKVFDRAIFSEIKHSILLFGDTFTAIRPLRHIGRLISYQFLFRKTVNTQAANSPDERHLSLKLIKTQIATPQGGFKTVLGILGAMNVLRDNEMFEERHIIEAIAHCLSGIQKIDHSFLLERKTDSPIRLFYIEIEKQDGTEFTLLELKHLKKHLPHEIKDSVESGLSPILIPRNEEEIMRNILLLSDQLHSISDLPQVIISFNTQTEHTLIFTVILVRALRESDLSLKEILTRANTELIIQDLEVKRAGLLRKRYPKEANVLKVALNKKSFLRRDFTIDLFRARQKVSKELHLIFHGIRDFNGGILSKQLEAFDELKKHAALIPHHKEFLLENFFYGITPQIRQTLIPPAVLKSLYSLLLKNMASFNLKEGFGFESTTEQQHLLIAASSQSNLKEEIRLILLSLNVPAHEFALTSISGQGTHCVGILYQNHQLEKQKQFQEALLLRLKDSSASAAG